MFRRSRMEQRAGAMKGEHVEAGGIRVSAGRKGAWGDARAGATSSVDFPASRGVAVVAPGCTLGRSTWGAVSVAGGRGFTRARAAGSPATAEGTPTRGRARQRARTRDTRYALWIRYSYTTDTSECEGATRAACRRSSPLPLKCLVCIMREPPHPPPTPPQPVPNGLAPAHRSEAASCSASRHQHARAFRRPLAHVLLLHARHTSSLLASAAMAACRARKPACRSRAESPRRARSAPR